jgi:DNA-binding MarR family transcriptional regulator
MSHQIDSDSYRIGRLVQRLYRAVERETSEQRGGFGVSAAERTVLGLIQPEESLSVPQIATRYGVSRQHVQATVNSLVDKGLARAVDNPVHKRSPLIRLTERGREVLDAVQQRESAAMDHLFAGVPAEERMQAREMLDMLVRRLS